MGFPGRPAAIAPSGCLIMPGLARSFQLEESIPEDFYFRDDLLRMPACWDRWGFTSHASGPEPHRRMTSPTRPPGAATIAPMLSSPGCLNVCWAIRAGYAGHRRSRRARLGLFLRLGKAESQRPSSRARCNGSWANTRSVMPWNISTNARGALHELSSELQGARFEKRSMSSPWLGCGRRTTTPAAT
jgi:hypothetical protein